MIVIVQWSAMLTGPFFAVLLVGLYVARRLFSDARILFELTEPMLIVAAAIFAVATAGIIAQII
ncbi:hypothetical protein GPROT1_01244 [Gammaproteobacteria bacterium]|nr:hypothetical protein GPROT1_01244 [Gammaproteobacteria bacterium]